MTTSRLGTYQLLEPLRRGALAELFLAQAPADPDTGASRLVIVKKFDLELVGDPARAAHVPEKAREVLGLSHPNVVTVLEVGRDADQPWIACDDVPGVSLRDLLDRFLARGESMPLPLAVRILTRVCEGLSAVHASVKPRVHGAVSARSIRLGLDGSVKLDDHGFAPREGARADAARSEQLGFLSPEQVLGEPLDVRSDVFSVGLVLFELLTGLRLYGASNTAATLQMVLDGEVPPVRSLNPALSEAIENTALKALARSPDQRFSSVAALQAALLACVDGELPSISAVLDRELPEARSSETALRQRLVKGAPSSMSSTPVPPPTNDTSTSTPADPGKAKKPRKAGTRKSKSKKAVAAEAAELETAGASDGLADDPDDDGDGPESGDLAGAEEGAIAERVLPADADASSQSSEEGGLSAPDAAASATSNAAASEPDASGTPTDEGVASKVETAKTDGDVKGAVEDEAVKAGLAGLTAAHTSTVGAIANEAPAVVAMPSERAVDPKTGTASARGDTAAAPTPNGAPPSTEPVATGVTDPAGKPATENAGKVPSETSAKPAIDATAKPAIDAAAKPAIDAGAKPAADVAAKSATDAAAKPAIDAGAKPAIDDAAKPAIDAGAKPAIDAASKPAIDAASKPAIDAGAKPAIDAASKPAIDAGAKLATDAASKPALNSATTPQAATGSSATDAAEKSTLTSDPKPELATAANPAVDAAKASPDAAAKSVTDAISKASIHSASTTSTDAAAAPSSESPSKPAATGAAIPPTDTAKVASSDPTLPAPAPATGASIAPNVPAAFVVTGRPGDHSAPRPLSVLTAPEPPTTIANGGTPAAEANAPAAAAPARPGAVGASEVVGVPTGAPIVPGSGVQAPSPAANTTNLPAAFDATAEISATAEVNLPPYRRDEEDDEEEEEERTQILNTAMIAASLPDALGVPVFSPPPSVPMTPQRPAEAAPRKVGVAVRGAGENAGQGTLPRGPSGTNSGTPRPSAMHPSPAGAQRPATRPATGGTNPGAAPRGGTPGAARTGMQPAIRTPNPGTPGSASNAAATPRTQTPVRPGGEPDLFAPQPRRTASLPAMPAVGSGQTPARRPNTRSGLTPSGAKRPDSRSGPAPRRTPHEELPRSGQGTPVARTFSASHPAFDAVKIAAEAEKEAANRARGLQPEVEILASSSSSSAPAQPIGAAALAQQDPGRPLEAEKRPAVVPVRSAAKDAVSTPVPKGLYYLAGAMALFLMLGLGLIIREPSEAKVVIDATPAEAVMITIGGRQVASGEKVSFPPGEYELVATAKGYKRYTQRITVFEGAPDSTYPIVLESDEPVDIVPAVPVVTGAKFSLQFTSATPEVEVWVDGVSVGITPKASVSLDIGRSYRYEARAQGYEPVEGLIGSFGETQLAVPLPMRKSGTGSEPSGRGKLVLTTTPPGAEIHIDGVPTGRRTPVTTALPIEVPAGRHVLQFKLDGKSSAPQRVTLGVGQAVMLENVAVDLE